MITVLHLVILDFKSGIRDLMEDRSYLYHTQTKPLTCMHTHSQRHTFTHMPIYSIKSTLIYHKFNSHSFTLTATHMNSYNHSHVRMNTLHNHSTCVSWQHGRKVVPSTSGWLFAPFILLKNLQQPPRTVFAMCFI